MGAVAGLGQGPQVTKMQNSGGCVFLFTDRVWWVVGRAHCIAAQTAH